MTDSDWAAPFFAGKTVVVTGGTGGIGLAIATAFRDAGAAVHATGATQSEIEAAHAAPAADDIAFSVLDVRNDQAVGAFAAGFGKIAALVNCAGVNLRAAEFTPAGFETVIDINLTGSMRTAMAFRDSLAGGAILNIASVYAFLAPPMRPPIRPARGALHS